MGKILKRGHPSALVLYRYNGEVSVANEPSVKNACDCAILGVMYHYEEFYKAQVFGKKGEFIYEIRPSPKTPGIGILWKPSSDEPIFVGKIKGKEIWHNE